MSAITSERPDDKIRRLMPCDAGEAPIMRPAAVAIRRAATKTRRVMPSQHRNDTRLIQALREGHFTSEQ